MTKICYSRYVSIYCNIFFMTPIEWEPIILQPKDRVPRHEIGLDVWSRVDKLLWEKIVTWGTLVCIPSNIILRLQHELRSINQEKMIFEYGGKTCISLWDLKDNWSEISKKIWWWERFEIIFWSNPEPTVVNQHLRTFTNKNWLQSSFQDLLSWKVTEINHTYKD